MKIKITQSVLALFILIGANSYTQRRTDMETNKKIVEKLYGVLNSKKFAELDRVVSNEFYIGNGDSTGIEIFEKSVIEFTDAFPDSQWCLLEMIAEGNKVFVKQKVNGTHRGFFQNIEPTYNSISVDGMAIYTLKDGKIISHELQTDRLAFLQQLNAIEIKNQPSEDLIYFVDEFQFPKSSLNEFKKKLQENRLFIQKLDGYLHGQAMIGENELGNIIILTTAVWKDQSSLEKAKELVQEKFEQEGFRPKKFYELLDVQVKRQIFYPLILR